MEQLARLMVRHEGRNTNKITRKKIPTSGPLRLSTLTMNFLSRILKPPVLA